MKKRHASSNEQFYNFRNKYFIYDLQLRLRAYQNIMQVGWNFHSVVRFK